MKKLLFITVILIISGFARAANTNLTNEERGWLSNHKIIRIAPDPEFTPIEWIDENGLYQGISTEFMDLISQELDIKFEVVKCSNWEEVLQKARDRDVDMLSAAAQTPQRAEYMDFSSPYLIFPGVIITRNDYTEIKTIEHLHNKKVVIVSGYVWQDMLTLHHPKIEIVQVNSLQDGLRDISMGMHDVIIATLPIALYYIEKDGILNLRVTGETGYYTKLSILTRKDWPMLGTIIQKTLSNIPTNKKEAIIKKWITIKNKSIFSNKQFWLILISIICLSFVGFIIIYTWNGILKKLIRKRTSELEEDIAKRKITEKTLVKSEEKFKLFAENVPGVVSIYQWHPDGHREYIYQGPGMEKIVGEELAKKIYEDQNEYFKLIPEEDFKALDEASLKAFQSNKNLDFEYRLIIDESNIRWVRALFNSFKREDGVFLWQGLINDITEHKQLEKELKESENKYRALAETSSDIIITLDMEGNFTYISPASKRITGFNWKHFLGHPFIELIVPEFVELSIESFKKGLTGKKMPLYEIEILHKNGSKIPVELNVSNLFDINGNVIGRLAMVRDISERKIAENALTDSEQKYRSLVETSSDWIWEMNLKGKHIYSNNVCKKILGFSSSKICNMDTIELVHPEDQNMFIEIYKQAIHNKSGWNNIVTRWRNKDGIYIYLESSALPQVDLNKEIIGFIGVDRDITERKKAEEENKENSKKMEKHFEKSERQRIATLSILSDLNKTSKKLHLEINERKHAEKIQKTLFNISNAVNTVDNLHDLYSKIRDFLGNVIDTTNFYIALYNKKTDMIYLPFDVDEKDNYETFPAGKTLTELVLKTGKSILVDEKLLKKLIKENKVEIIGTPALIWLGVPLKVENEIIGVIAVQSYDDPNLYSEKDITLLNFISEEIALSIKHIQSDKQLKINLTEKNILLQEIYHRTKNNMQLIISLLKLEAQNMEKRSLTENVGINLLHDSYTVVANKIKSMSLVHEKLYKAKDLSHINLKEYIEDLVRQLMGSYNIRSEKIKLKLELEDVFILIDSAIPLGLILSELITNVFKHAFPNNAKGEISVRLFKEKDDTINLLLGDNGVGIPKEVDLEKTETMGIKTVFSHIKYQLGGQIRYDTDNGMKWNFKFKDNQYKKRV